MKTRVLDLGQICLSLVFCLGLTACNKDGFYEKDYLENPNQEFPTTGSSNGGNQGGVDSGVDGGSAQGGVEGGVNGGTNGSTTSGSSTTGGTVGGTTGSSTGGTEAGSTTGTTTAGTTGGTTGGVTGSTTGGTTGSTNGGTTGGTTGVVYQTVSENFKQAASQTKKLDVLWVIDNSGSMADEQESLGYNFDAFINDFIDRDVDFKMAITTTDTSSSSKKGAMVSGSDTKLTSARAKANPNQFKSDFRSLVKVGTKGSGNEKGLEATEGFMEKYSSSWTRSDAYLAVVILSDEEDSSSKTVASYTDYLKSFKATAGLVKVYSIVDVGLSNAGVRGVTAGYARYKLASDQTAGSVGDIRDDFYQVLSDMGGSIIKLLDSFALAHEPIPGSLKVYVNGELVTHYSYDSATHSIKFDANNLPPVGANIQVTYLK